MTTSWSMHLISDVFICRAHRKIKTPSNKQKKKNINNYHKMRRRKNKKYKTMGEKQSNDNQIKNYLFYDLLYEWALDACRLWAKYTLSYQWGVIVLRMDFVWFSVSKWENEKATTTHTHTRMKFEMITGESEEIWIDCGPWMCPSYKTEAIACMTLRDISNVILHLASAVDTTFRTH